MPRPENLYADLLVAPFRVFGGRKVHLVDVSSGASFAVSYHLPSQAICGERHRWARPWYWCRECANCLRVARVLAAPKGNP